MQKETKSVPVIKAADEELKQVLFIAMLPDSTDLHGDYTSSEEVRKAKESFNRSQMNTNLYHEEMTDSFEVLESYLAPVDFVLGDKFVAKGTWLMSFQIHDDQLWELVKNGEINGISIGALASIEKVDEEEDDN